MQFLRVSFKKFAKIFFFNSPKLSFEFFFSEDLQPTFQKCIEIEKCIENPEGVA